MFNMPKEIPKEIVKNQFLVLILASLIFVIFSLIYNVKYILNPAFITFVYFYLCFLVNIFFVKVVYKNKVAEANRWLEFGLLFVLTGFWLFLIFNLK
jgi:cell division protein FtsW (lipid II flippase)